MGNTIIVCGLTEWENEIVRKHKGECRHCMHNETWHDGKEVIKRCAKHGLLDEFKTDCKDWLLDTR